MIESVNWTEIEKEAADKIAQAMKIDLVDFDPWELFPSVYGSYSSDFDSMAIEVLWALITDADPNQSLAHKMFREMLCTADLCDYGSSPRYCFPTESFKPLIEPLIEKWTEYAKARWRKG